MMKVIYISTYLTNWYLFELKEWYVVMLNIEIFTDTDRYFVLYSYKRVSSPKITELRDHQELWTS